MYGHAGFTSSTVTHHSHGLRLQESEGHGPRIGNYCGMGGGPNRRVQPAESEDFRVRRRIDMQGPEVSQPHQPSLVLFNPFQEE